REPNASDPLAFGFQSYGAAGPAADGPTLSSHRPMVVPSSERAAMKPPAGSPLRIGFRRTVTFAPAGNVDGRYPWRPSEFVLPHSRLLCAASPFPSVT